VWSSRQIPMFWKNLLLLSSRYNVQATGSSEMLVPKCQTTWCHMTEDYTFNIHCHENLNTDILCICQFFIQTSWYVPPWLTILIFISALKIIWHLSLCVALLCSVFWINCSSVLYFKCHCISKERCQMFWLCLYSALRHNYYSVLYQFAGSTFHKIQK
jgi:hypothetical protein